MATGTRSAELSEVDVIEASEPVLRNEVPSKPLPPLRNGDFLSRAEFERRFDAMEHLKKAELIEGMVYIPSPDFYLPEGNPPQMASPVSFERHAEPHFHAIAWLGHYEAYTPGARGGDNGSLRLDLDNMPQPDAFLISSPKCGGRVHISDDDYIEGAPELVVEIAYSSVSYDLHAKLHVYRRNQAQEYVVWRVEDEKIDWFRLREGRYERIPLTVEGHYRSEVFPGLWLDPAAILKSDMVAVFDLVRQGVATPEHAAFVDRLKAAIPAQGNQP